MKNFRLPVLLLVINSMIISSCLTTIKSNKSPDFTDKVSKIYVVMKMSQNAKRFTNKLEKHLAKEFEKRNVVVAFDESDPLSLESNEEVDTRINEFAPDAVLVINQTEGMSTRDPYLGVGLMASRAILDIKMFIPGTENPVWRASLKTDSANIGLSTTAPTSTRSIVNKLIADRIIRR